MTIQKKYLILFSLAIIFCVMIIFLGTFLFRGPSSSPEDITPVITPYQQSEQSSGFNPPPDISERNAPYNQAVQEEMRQEQEQLQKDGAVYDFRQSLPYRGFRMNVTYDIRTNSYIVTLDNSFQTEGRNEFLSLLKERNIDPSYIKIVYQ